jgi:hypothetical protein
MKDEGKRMEAEGRSKKIKGNSLVLGHLSSFCPHP